jgi:hypothetical protein
MYITDATHFMDDKGAIGPKHGPGRRMADFLGSIIVTATLFTPGARQPQCIECSGSVEATVAASDDIHWKCSACAEEGRISNWRHTLWDMTANRSAAPFLN